MDVLSNQILNFEQERTMGATSAANSPLRTRLELAEKVREHIERLRTYKLEVTRQRDGAEDPAIRQKLEELRRYLSRHEKREIELYGRLVPVEALTLN